MHCFLPRAIFLALLANSAMAAVTSTTTVTISSCSPEVPITSTLTVTSTACVRNAPCGLAYTVAKSFVTPLVPSRSADHQAGGYAWSTPAMSNQDRPATKEYTDTAIAPDCTDGQTSAVPSPSWHAPPSASNHEYPAWKPVHGSPPSTSVDDLPAKPSQGEDGAWVEWFHSKEWPYATAIPTKQAKATETLMYDFVSASSVPSDYGSKVSWPVADSAYLTAVSTAKAVMGKGAATTSWSTHVPISKSETAVAAMFTGGASRESSAMLVLFGVVFTFVSITAMVM